MMEPFGRKLDQAFLTADTYNPLSGLLMEALCLEVPASRNQIRRAFLKTASLKKPNSAIRESRRDCGGCLFHRKSKSLDSDINELAELNGNFMVLQMSQRQSRVSVFSSSSEAQPFFGNGSLARMTEFLGSTSTVTNDLIYNRITHEESSSTTSSTSISNAVPPRLTPRDVLQSTADSTSAHVLHSSPTRLAGTDQRLTRREINKLKNLRRKQRKREKWLLEHRQVSPLKLCWLLKTI